MLSTTPCNQVDLSKLGKHEVGPITVEIIDSVVDYLALLKEIFDFKAIKAYLQSHKDVKVLFDGLNGVTGPYGRAIFVEELGLGDDSIQGCVPSPDFGGGHPDPNLTYAHDLVERVEREKIAFGAASDGDGDRNMSVFHTYLDASLGNQANLRWLPQDLWCRSFRYSLRFSSYHCRLGRSHPILQEIRR